MTNDNIQLTGVERFFDDDEIIVSKTDMKGHLTYGNNLFCELAGYSERDLIGKPHNIIRHPDMPRCVFKLLWDTIQDGQEIFAYVINRSRNGDHYWVLAHVTPSRDSSGNMVGYHSNRRVPKREVLDETIIPLYKSLLAEELKIGRTKEAMAASGNLLANVSQEKGMAYDELIFALGT